MWWLRYRPIFFDQIGHQTTSASIGNKHYFTISCHCQTYQPTKNGPIFRKQSTSKFSKNAINKSWSPNLIFFTEKNQKDSIDFWCSKMTLNVRILQSLRRLFIILVGLTMTWYSENSKNAYFQYMHTWFDAQLDQKILKFIY